MGQSHVMEAMDTGHPPEGLMSEAEIAAAARRTLSGHGPVFECRQNCDGAGTSVFYFARHADVATILRREADFGLPHYDELLGQVAGDVRFLLGDACPARDQRWALLSEALGGANIHSPLDAACVEPIARDVAASVVRALRRRPSRRFNMVWEYGLFVPYQAASRFFGFEGPRHMSWLLKTLLFFARLVSILHAPVGREAAPLNSMLAWTIPLNVHLFSNFKGRNLPLRLVAKWTARSYRRHIDHVWQHAECAPADSMLARLWRAVYTAPSPLKDQEARELAAKSILFELYGTMLILVGLSFNRMVRVLADQNISFEDFAFDLSHGNAEQSLHEAMRFNPVAGRLYRVAKHDCHFAGADIRAGDYLCLLMDSACRDEAVYGCPHLFGDVRPHVDHLIFGPADGPHACKGQNWARAILKAMFLELAQLPNLAPDHAFGGTADNRDGAKPAGPLGLPDGILWHFDA